MPEHDHMAAMLTRSGAPTSPLSRLNFFDGLFLRADLLRTEQSGMRSLVFQSNAADGPGITFGLNATMDGGALSVSPGLAIDGQGRVLLLLEPARADLADLLAPRQPDKPKGFGMADFEFCVDFVEERPHVVETTRLYAVVLRHAESACGWEEVRGRACEDACDSSMERPYLVDTARIHLCPVHIDAPMPSSESVLLGEAHLRSRVASAYFAEELLRADTRISGTGLHSLLWCNGATDTWRPCGDDVPLALLAVRGGAKVFLDPWVVRRERVETPPHRYWAGRMRMRPWDVYLAQVLQFQCELADLLDGVGPTGPGPVDPCNETRGLLNEALGMLDDVRLRTAGIDTGGAIVKLFNVDKLKLLESRARDVLHPGTEARRILVDRGIVELPAAGYLPVDPKGDRPLTRQVADLLGPGVDLRFCGVRLDQVAGEFESCQHLDRISLLTGIDDPARREKVDILVPDGDVGAAPVAGRLFELDLALSPRNLGLRGAEVALNEAASTNRFALPLVGAARIEAGVSGPFAVYAAVSGGVKSRTVVNATRNWITRARTGTGEITAPNFTDAVVSPARFRTTALEVRTNRSAEGLGRIAASTSDGEVVVGWIGCTVDANPLSVGRGEGGRWTYEAVWYMPTTPGFVIALEGSGVFRVLDAAPGEATVVIQGELIVSESGSETGRENVNRDAVIRLSDGALDIESEGSSLKATWSGSPAAAIADAILGASFFVNGDLRESTAVAFQGNEHHERALAALTVLDGSSTSPGFAERSAAKLFGEVESDPAVIQTEHDWVLFRRRIRHDYRTEEAAPVQDRRVAVWHALADHERDAARFESAVREGRFGEAGWRRLGTAVFAGTTAQLRTTAAQMKSSLASIGGGNVVQFAGYAPVGPFVQPGSGDRLRALVQSLAPDAVLLRPEADALTVLDGAPAEFGEAGSDASVFVITHNRAPRNEKCIEVRGIEDRNDSAVWEAVYGANVGAVPDGDQTKIAQLGTVSAGDGPTQAVREFVQGTSGEGEVVAWVTPMWLANQGEDAVRQLAETLLSDVLPSMNLTIRKTDFESQCHIRFYIRPHFDG